MLVYPSLKNLVQMFDHLMLVSFQTSEFDMFPMSVTLIPDMNIEGTSGFYNMVKCQALVMPDTNTNC